MGLSKKKIVVVLMAIAMYSGSTFAYLPQSDANEGTKSLIANSGSLSGREPNLTVGSYGNHGDGELFFKMILMVLLVVAFGVVAIYLSKKLLPKITRMSGKRIQIAETVHLGPRKAIHLPTW